MGDTTRLKAVAILVLCGVATLVLTTKSCHPLASYSPFDDAVHVVPVERMASDAATLARNNRAEPAVDREVISPAPLNFTAPEPFLKAVMSPSDSNFLRSIAAHATYWFEWGMGGSTSTALAQQGVQRVHSVESDVRWVDKLSRFREVEDAASIGRIKLEHADIGEVAEWGKPVDMKTFNTAWLNYPQALWNANEARWDTIFVDGRFRVACALTAVKYAVLHDTMYDDNEDGEPALLEVEQAEEVDKNKPQPPAQPHAQPKSQKSASGRGGRTYTTILMHDYVVRKHYHFVEKYLETVHAEHVLVQFRVNRRTIEAFDDFDAEIEADLERYYRDPR